MSKNVLCYTYDVKKEKQIIESREKVKAEQEMLKSVPITQAVYDYLMNVKTRANRTNDKYGKSRYFY